MAGKVKNDLIDLYQFYRDIEKLKLIPEVRSHCQHIITNSVGTQVSKDRFVRMLAEAANTNKMIKLVTDYALAGQGLAVGKTR